jgi:hypothetical protein
MFHVMYEVQFEKVLGEDKICKKKKATTWGHVITEL